MAPDLHAKLEPNLEVQTVLSLHLDANIITEQKKGKMNCVLAMLNVLTNFFYVNLF